MTMSDHRAAMAAVDAKAREIFWEQTPEAVRAKYRRLAAKGLGVQREAYEPEQWDVVRADGMVIISGTDIADADNQTGYLNAHSAHRGPYEVRPSAVKQEGAEQ